MIEELYKKKVIRDFLSLFSETKWKELVTLVLEYGIITLKRNRNVASLSLDDLNGIVDDLKEEDNKRVRQNMKKFENENSMERRNGSKSRATDKPSSGWRRGDELVFDQHRNNSDANNVENVNCDIKPINFRDLSKSRELNKRSTLEKIIKTNNDRVNVVNYANIYPKWWGDVDKTKKSKKINNYKTNLNSKTQMLQSGSRINYGKTNTKVSSGYYSDSSSSNQKNQIFNKLASNHNHPKRSGEKIINPYFDKRKLNETESKIRSHVQTDKKIYHLLKQKEMDPNYTNNENEEGIDNYNYSGGEKYFNDEGVYDKNNNVRYENENIEDNNYNVVNAEEQCRNMEQNQNFHYYKTNNVYQDQNKFVPQNNGNNIIQNFDHDESQISDYNENYQNYNRSKYMNNNMQYDQLIQEDKTIKSNYVIEYDKELKPHIIKEMGERHQTSTGHPNKQNNFQNIINHQDSNLDSSSNRNFPNEAPYFQPNEMSHLDHNRLNHDSTYIQNRHNDTFLREQHLLNNNVIKNDNKRQISSLISNTYIDNNESSLSINNGNNSPYETSNKNRNQQSSNRSGMNNFSAFKSNRDHSEVLSPHFNNSRNVKNYCSKEKQGYLHEESNIENEDFVKPAVSFQKRIKDELNQSDRLSSYTPSERTKKYFKKDLNQNNVSHSRYSKYSNKNESPNDSQKFESSFKEDKINQSSQGCQEKFTGKLNEKDLQKINSSNDELEILNNSNYNYDNNYDTYSSQKRDKKTKQDPEEKVKNTSTIYTNKYNTSQTEEMDDLEIFNSAAEKLNYRIQELLKKK